MTFEFPKMVLVRQAFPATPPVDVAQAVEQQLTSLQPRVKQGARIAVGVGSRGITNLAEIVGTTIRVLNSWGARPFIIPAMGSHGGATPEGQKSLLAEYGVTEQAMDVPIQASMEVEQIGTTGEGVEVFCSVEALRTDGIVLINRIKPHTDFSGAIGSGILKMSVIGLGKRAGASNYHAAAGRFGYEEVLRSIARVILARAPVLGGLAILENQLHQTAKIALLPREQVERMEEELFVEAKRLMPKLPIDDMDLLIVDQLGKNVSGSGVDPNIIGRGVHGYSSFLGQKNLPPPRIKRIFVRDLTMETHGNAIGIGFADLTTTRLVQNMDREVTYINALTSLTPNGAKIPIHFDTDKQAFELGLRSLGLPDPAQAVVLRIRDTLSLDAIEASEAAVPLLRANPNCRIAREGRRVQFDEAGNLPPLSGLFSEAAS